MVSEKGNVLAIERWKGEPDDVDNIEIGKWETWGEYIGFARIEDVNKLRRAVNYLVKTGHVHDWYKAAFDVMTES